MKKKPRECYCYIQFSTLCLYLLPLNIIYGRYSSLRRSRGGSRYPGLRRLFLRNHNPLICRRTSLKETRTANKSLGCARNLGHATALSKSGLKDQQLYSFPLRLE
ncbi:hypothetical protein AOQ84DRAFT_47128 [Glonium stellatum]|uniref:Uncharacterized protein n=1 Tax=Glonium stellatum TaxID=574774 RepID=A0A8E2F038_9PEZI|nr:hypothetical protein AOQ84DRAFT_47128 [Glonium stellatum]